MSARFIVITMHATARRPLWVRAGAGILAAILFLTNTVYPVLSFLPAPPIVVAQEETLIASDSAEATPAASVATPAPSPLDPLDNIDSLLLLSSPSAEILLPEDTPETTPSASSTPIPEAPPEDQTLPPSPSPSNPAIQDLPTSLPSPTPNTSPNSSKDDPVSKLPNTTPTLSITNLTPLKPGLIYPFVGNAPVSYGFGEHSTNDFVLHMQSLFGVEAHDGVDFAMPEGTSILATDNGVVTHAGYGDYGNTIVISHTWGTSYYGHLSTIYVEPGTPVSKGTLIALSGNTGVSTAPHLHFGIRPSPADYGNGYHGMIDPIPYLQNHSLSPTVSDTVLGVSTFKSSKIKILNRNEQVVDAKVSTDQSGIHISPPRSFVPGTYTVLSASSSGTLTQTLSWGVLTLNFDHSPYTLGDMAHLQMAALTETGFTICDANLSLLVTKPDGSSFVATTATHDIQQSSTCDKNNVTSFADYSYYLGIDQVGTYNLSLLNLDTNQQLNRSFTSTSSTPTYRFSRQSATRINPFLSDYEMTLTITSTTDQKLTIKEPLPSSFTITDAQDATVSLVDSDLVLSWERDLQKDIPTIIHYRYQAPPQSPAIYQVGPATLYTDQGIVTETNYWQIAGDAATYSLKTGYYVGSGIPQKIVVGFAPQYVMIKSASTIATVFKTTAMPVLNTAFATATADSTGGDITFDATGFTITGSNTNAANVVHQYIAVTGSDCSSSGVFCIGSYQGSGAAKTITTGFQPDIIIAKSATNAVAATLRTSSMGTNVGQYMIATTQDTTGILFQTISSNSFTVGTTNSSNAVTYYYVAFKNVTGSIGVGTFTGSAADNRAITGVGFTPNMVLVKNANAAVAVSAVWNTTQNYGDNTSYMTATANLVDAIQSLDSDGFTVGTNSVVNGNGNTIYYIAFGSATADPAASGTFKMATGTFTGTAALQQITGLEFAPDLVIVKGNTTQAGAFRTRMMGGDTTAYLDAATANFTGGIISLNTDGFTLGTNAITNNSGTTYYYIAFGNAYNPMTKSGASDFFIGAYYGNGIDSRNITNLPFQPDMVTVKRSGATGGVFRTADHSSDTTSYFAATADLANSIQSLRSDGFQVGTNATVNTAANVYWYFGFKDGSNFTTNTYTGTGSANTISTVGFQSNLLWVKAATAVRGVERTSDGATDSALPFINVGAVTGAITGITSTGFSVGTATETNTNGTTYRYVGWRKTITISGTANGNSGATIKVAYNGTLQTPTTTISAGTWSLDSGLPTASDVVTVWVDGVADSLESTASTLYSSGNITGMVLNTNALTLGSNQNTSLSLTNLNSYDCSENEDIMHQAASSHLKVEGDACAGSTTNSYTSEKISVISGNTLTLATSETITTYDLENLGTITVSGNGIINTSHDWTNTGTFTAGTGTVNLTGGDSTTQTISGNTTFNNLSATTTSNSLGRTISYTAGSTTTVSGTWTMTGATSKILTLQSTSSSAWTIIPTTISASYLNVSYSTNNGTLFCSTNSSDSGNNTNWIISSGSGCSSSAYSFQRKTWSDGTRYWRSTQDGANGRIIFEYSTNGTSWTENTSARITTNTTDYSVQADSTGAYIAYTNGFDIETRAATSYPGTSFAWSTATTPYNGTSISDSYYYPTLTQDTNNKIWVGTTHNSSGTYTYEAIRASSPNSIASWNTATSLDSSANSNKYGVITPKSYGRVYATWVDNTTIEGKEHGFITPTKVSSATDTTTTSTTYTAMDSMSTTPGAGNYLVSFSTSIMKSTGLSDQYVSLYVAGSQVAHTERYIEQESSYDGGNFLVIPVTIQAYVSNLGASDTIEIRWRTTAGTATAKERSMIVQEVSSSDMSQATATADDTTTSATDTQINSMTLTPGAGDYIVYFNGSIENPSVSHTYISLYTNSTQVTHSERDLYTEDSFTNTFYPVSTQAYISGLNGSDSITVRWRTTAGTARIVQRTLVVQKVDSSNVTQVTATSSTNTTSTSDTQINTMTSTPGSGNYLVFFSTSLNTNTSDTTQNLSLYAAGSQAADSEREQYVEFSFDTGDIATFPVTSQAYFTSLGGSDTIEARYRTTAGTVSALQRTMTIIKIDTTSSTESIGTGTSGLTTTLSALNVGNNIHVAFVNDSGQIQYRTRTTSWQTVVTLDSNSGNAYPTISRNTSNDNLYVFWVRSDDIFYKKGVSTYASGNWDASATSWQTASTLTRITSNISGSNLIFALWSDGGTAGWGALSIGSNTAPNSPTSLAQKTTGDVTLSTGSWHNSASLKFTATATDTDNPDTLQLCIEIDQLGTSFSNTEDSCGSGVSYTGSGVTVTHTVTVTDAQEYHWQARVKDAGGFYSSWVSYDANAESARDIGVDTTAPTGGTVYDGTNVGVDTTFATSSLSSLSANWASFNTNVSGLLRYDYSIGTTAGGTDIKAWTDNSTNTSVTATGLTLQTSQLYYVNVRAVDNAGNVQSAVSSNGQLVSPSISFSVTPATTTFNNLGAGNSYSDTQTTTLTTSTNAYNGYIIRAFTTDLLKTVGGTHQISNFSAGSYASPSTWNGSETGFGYTSSDSTIQGSDKFGSGTLYAPFSQTGPGDIVADHTSTVTGTSISNESFNITYKVKVPSSQAAANYTSTVVYTATAQY